MAKDAHTLTDTPTTPAATATAQTAIDAINLLKTQATATLGEEFHAIAEAARHDDARAVSLRLEQHNTKSNLVGTVAWLARDLADVLLKVATDNEPHSVMGGDLPARIREAEIRLEMLRELAR